MTRQELNEQLNLKDDIYRYESTVPILELRKYIELRLIADALININESLNATIHNGNRTYNNSISENLFDISQK